MNKEKVNTSLLESIYKNSSIAIQIFNNEGCLNDMNEACCRLFGIDSIDDLKGFKLFEDPNIPQEQLVLLLTGNSVRYEAEYDFDLVKRHHLYDTACSGILYLDVSIAPILDESKTECNYLVQIVDLTKHRNAEQELKWETRRREALFDQTPDGVLIIDPKTSRFIEFNTVAHQQLGYTREEFSKLTILDVEAKETAEETEATISKVLTNGYYEFGTLHRTKTGDIRNVHVKAKIIEIAGYSIYQCIWRDVTEQKMAETALRKSEELFSQIFNKAPLIFSIMDLATGKFIEVNEATVENSGYRREEIIGRTTEELGWIAEKDRINVIKYLNCADRKNGIEISFHTKNRNLQDCIYFGDIITIGGKQVLISIAQNISKQKQVENELKDSTENYRRLVDNINDLVCEIDENGAYTYLNNKYEEIMGYKPDELLGRMANELIHPDDLLISRQKYEKLKKTNMPSSDIWRFKHKDNSYRIFESKGKPFIDSKNRKRTVVISRDITEKQKSDEALRESESRFLSAFEYAPIGKTLVSPEGAFLKVNKALCDILGYSDEELTALTFQDITHPDDLETDLRYLKAMLNGETNAYQMEKRYIAKDGRIIWVLLSVSLVKDENLKPLYFISQIQDISERKVAEDALRIKSEELDRYFNNSLDLLCIANTAGEFVRLNPEWEKVLGYSLSELEGKIFLDFIHPDDLQPTVIAISQMQNQEEVTSFENRYRCKDGSYRWIEWRAKALGKDIYAVARDITTRKETEEKLKESESKYRNLINNLHAGIVVHNPDTTIMFCNQEASTLLGLSQNQLEGKDSLDPGWFFLDETGRRLFPEEYPIVKVVTSKSSLINVTYGVVRPTSQDRIWVQVNAFPEFDTDGNIKLVVVTFLNITDRKIAEEELAKHRAHLEELVKTRTAELDSINVDLKREIELKKEVEQQLEEGLEKEKELSNLKSRFISTASHEFRTPLTSILMSSGLIQRYYHRWDEKKINEHFEEVQNSVTRLTKLIDDVLLINRAEMGRVELKLARLDLLDLCNKVIIDSQVLKTEKHNFVFKYNTRRKIFRFDQNQIELVLRNLLSNAFKYSPKGGKIELTVLTEKEKLKIIISDEGIGIPSEEIPKLYDNFHRAQNASDIQGTGLGLSIVKNAVDLHRGTIKVDSTLNKGTTFTVTIS